MKKVFKKALAYLTISMLILPTCFFSSLSKIDHAKAAVTNDNVLISEIQIAGTKANDEFVELYNPTGSAIKLDGWILVKKTASGVPSDLVASITGTIQPSGYFLMAGSDYSGLATPDLNFDGSTILASDNSVSLYSNLGVVIDKVGMGSANDFENKATVNPAANKSVERFYDNNVGNYLDTDDNSTDFYLQSKPNPQNSTSTDLFTTINNGTSLTLESGSRTTAKKNETINLDIKITYPNDVMGANNDYLADAMLVSDKTIPAGTTFDLYYNSTKLGTGVLNVQLDPSIGIYLSDVIKALDPSLPVRTPLNLQAGSATWGLSFLNLPDDNYNFKFGAVTSKQFTDLNQVYVLGSLTVPVVVDSFVAAPTNVVATRNGNSADLTWDNVTDTVSGLAGYNLYSSADNFVNPINTTLITKNQYSVNALADGEYSFKVVAVDNAKNEAATLSNKIGISSVAFSSPSVTVTSTTTDGNRYIHVEWQGVGNYVNKYDIYVNGVLSVSTKVDSTNLNDKGVVYKNDIKVSADGTYNVYVKVWRDETSLDSETKSVNFVTESVVEETTPVVSVAASKAYAAPATTENKIETPTDDSNGQIKGDESATEDNTDTTNWTPWIVLFVLIILAGAATGGYFYWFSGEEEIETVVHAPKKDEKAEKQKKATPVANTVKKTNKTGNTNKKIKRW